MLELLIEAIKNNEINVVRELLHSMNLITKKEYIQLTQAIEEFEELINCKILKALKYTHLLVEANQNDIIIAVPYMHADVDYLQDKSLDILIASPNTQVTITDVANGETLTIPTAAYLLINQEFYHFYMDILQNEFNISSLQNIDFVQAARMIAKHNDVDITDELEAISAIQEAVNKMPEIVKYINFASIHTDSNIYITEVGDYSRITHHYKTTLKVLADIISSENLHAMVRAIIARDSFENIARYMDNLNYFALNLGPIVQNNPDLASFMIKCIIAYEGHANGHILTSEEDIHLLRPIVAYAIDNEHREMAEMLVRQQDPLHQRAAQILHLKGHGIIHTTAARQAESHINNNIYICKLDGEIMTPILIHLMRKDFELAESYMQYRSITNIWKISEDNYNYKGESEHQEYALSVALDAGKYTLEAIVDKYVESVEWPLGNVMVNIIKSRRDVEVIHNKFNIKSLHTIVIDCFKEKAGVNTPLIIHFIEEGKWDIVDALIKAGINLNVCKVEYGKASDSQNPADSINPRAFDMAVAHGYGIDELNSYNPADSINPRALAAHHVIAEEVDLVAEFHE